MMEELQVLRDVTLFYNERHPELRSAVRKRAEDTNTRGSTENTTPARPATDACDRRSATDDCKTPTNAETDEQHERAGQSPNPRPAATQEESPGPATGAAGDTTTQGEH